MVTCMESVLGKKIKEYRVLKGITQEELGKLVGVTTQAVSKWERGGTPDAELLPDIAKVLGVSIDTLFGIKSNEESRLEDLIIEEISMLDKDIRFERAMALCYAVTMGLVGMNSFKNKAASEMLEKVDDELGHEFYSTLLLDEGIIRGRLSKNGRYFFMMPEPKVGYRFLIEDVEALSKTFELLADPDTLKIIIFMYQRVRYKQISVHLISESVGVPQEKVEQIMERFCEMEFAHCSEVETSDGEFKAYFLHKEAAVIPLLCFIRELRIKNVAQFLSLQIREKPIFDKLES